MRILTSTGRGGFLDSTKVSLDEIPNRYDRCPAELIDESRDAVIRQCEQAVRQIDQLRGDVDDGHLPPSPAGNAMRQQVRPTIRSPAVLNFRRRELERWIDQAIALLDTPDGDSDLEDDEIEDIDEREPPLNRVFGGAGL